eukprot:12907994-Prorocentrum_lima.AAC.1
MLSLCPGAAVESASDVAGTEPYVVSIEAAKADTGQCVRALKHGVYPDSVSELLPRWPLAPV